MRKYGEAEVVARLKAAIDAAGSLRKLAGAWGVSPAWLSMVQTGQKPPSDLIAEKLGMQRVSDVYYVNKQDGK